MSRMACFEDARYFSQCFADCTILIIPSGEAAKFLSDDTDPHHQSQVTWFNIVANFLENGFLSHHRKTNSNKLLLNGPPIAYKNDTFSIKIIYQNLQTATCHKAQISTSKKFVDDIILIRKVSRINTYQCDDILEVSWSYLNI